MSYPDLYRQQLFDAKNFLEKNIKGAIPKTALILGSGLGDFADNLEQQEVIRYNDIPNFPISGVPGHKGQLVSGYLEGKRVVAFQGRVHTYEGFSAAQASFGIRALGLLGVETLIVTNAAGGINSDFSAGDLMLIENHISLFCEDPLRGLQQAGLGEHFYDQTAPYSDELIALARKVGNAESVELKQGVYCMVPGPRFESAADIRALKVLGADAVGMSTVVEVLAARHIGIKNVLGISLISNLAAGISKNQLSHAEVIEAGNNAKEKFSRLISQIVAKNQN